MVGADIPPQMDKAGRGRISDVVAAVLDRCGYHATFTIVPFGRHWSTYRDDETYDGLATAEADQTYPGYSTEPFIHLQDGATIIQGSGLDALESVEGLAGKRIVAFPGADRILGIESVVATFASFRMRSNRFDQLRPLFSRRADAVLADGLITAHFIETLRANARAGLEPDVDASLAVAFRRIFPAGPQRLYFRDAAVARDFDRCFAELKESGAIAQIARPYVDRYRAVLGDQYPDY